MTSFDGGYRPPGVYVDNLQAGSLPNVGVGSTTPCLLGRGQGYARATEQKQFAGSASLPLSYKGVDPDSVVVTGIVSVGGVPTQTTFTRSTQGNTQDYQLSTTSDSGHAAVTSLVRETTGDIPLGTPLLVSYKYADDNYFALRRFDSYAAVVDVYGQPLDAVTGAVASPLSLAAQMAFANGAASFYGVAYDPSGNASETDQAAGALAKIVGAYDIDVVVPLFETLTNDSKLLAAATVVKNHLTAARGESIHRVCLLGASAGCVANPATVAASIDNQDIVLLWPPAVSFFNPVISATQSIDGFYAAAGAAGVLADQSVNRGLTQSVITGINGLPSVTPASTRDGWSSQGVSVMEVDRLGRTIIRHGVTTDASSVQSRELSVVREQYAFISLIQRNLAQANLIGNPITKDTPVAIKSITTGAAETALQANIITEYTPMVVQQQQLPSGDPTVIRVTFSYKPTYPLDYINVVMTLDLNTGSTDTTVTTTA